MKKAIVTLPVLTLVLAGLLFWQLPAIFQLVPSRYIARLPEPVQELSRRDVTPILPTPVAISQRPPDIDALLAEAAVPLPAVEATSLPDLEILPATATSIPTLATPMETPTPTLIPSPTSTPLPPSARLDGISHQFQWWNNCGPATLAMTLSYFDLGVTQAETSAWLKPNEEDRNVSPTEMAAFVNQQTDLAALTRTNGNLDLLRTFVANGLPVIVEVGIDPPGEYAWMEWYGHYLLVVSYDEASETFFVYDSWLGTGPEPGDNQTREGRRWGYEELDSYWRHFNRNYVVLYEPDQAALVAGVVGEEMDDSVMWQNALLRAQAEVEAMGQDAFAWFNLGTVYNALGQHESAAAAFDQARTIGLPRRMLWYHFAPYESYLELGRYEDVIVLADAVLDRPYIEEVLYYRGLALAAQGDMARARQDLEAAAAFNPRFSPAANALNELTSEES